MAEPSHSSLRVDATLETLQLIRRFVEQQARLAGFLGERLDDLILAVDEAATNIVMHGYQGQVEGAVTEVVVAFDDPVLSVTLRDRAKPFDPTATPVVDQLPPLSERGPGGLGIFLIRKTMDEFHYRRTPDGWNELKLSIYKLHTQED